MSLCEYGKRTCPMYCFWAERLCIFLFPIERNWQLRWGISQRNEGKSISNDRIFQNLFSSFLSQSCETVWETCFSSQLTALLQLSCIFLFLIEKFYLIQIQLFCKLSDNAPVHGLLKVQCVIPRPACKLSEKKDACLQGFLKT